MKSCQQQAIPLIAAIDVQKNFVGLSLYKSNCVMACEMKQQP